MGLTWTHAELVGHSQGLREGKGALASRKGTVIVAYDPEIIGQIARDVCQPTAIAQSFVQGVGWSNVLYELSHSR